MISDKFGVEVTEETWGRVDLTIRNFIITYPHDWLAFLQDLKNQRTEYQLAVEGDLKRASWRNTLAFPVVARPRSQEELDESPQASPVEFVASLQKDIDCIIPGFTAPDEGGERQQRVVTKNKLYREFIKRYGILFQPGEKN